LLIPQESEEAHALTVLWEYLMLPQLIVTFAGNHFDIPFLVKRSLILGVNVPGIVRTWLKRYSLHPHFDVREALTNWDSKARGTLDDWCTSFNLPLKHEGLTGADVPRLIANDEWDTLHEYAWGDANNALLLAEQIGTFYLSPNAH
jgi:hypothetical protein